MSVFGGYFHRHFYNQEAQENPLLTTADYAPFQVANPLGNGEMITLFNLNPAKAGLVQAAGRRNSDINRTIYDGFEVSFNARLPQRRDRVRRLEQRPHDHGQPAISTIRTSCGSATRPARPSRNTAQTSTPPFRNDFKLAGSYPLPWGIEVSGVFMSYAGKGNSYSAHDPSLGVYWAVPASVFPNGQRTQSPVSAPYSLNGGAVQNVTGVSLVAPGTKYQERWNQLDVSAKKSVRIKQRQLEGQVAVFNVTNNNVVLSEVQAFGTSLGRPLNILQGRMLRLALLVTF